MLCTITLFMSMDDKRIFSGIFACITIQMRNLHLNTHLLSNPMSYKFTNSIRCLAIEGNVVKYMTLLLPMFFSIDSRNW